MKVIARDPFISKDTDLNMPVDLVDMEDIFKNSDVISVHTLLHKVQRILFLKDQ